MKVMFVSLPK